MFRSTDPPPTAAAFAATVPAARSGAAADVAERDRSGAFGQSGWQSWRTDFRFRGDSYGSCLLSMQFKLLWSPCARVVVCWGRCDVCGL